MRRIEQVAPVAPGGLQCRPPRGPSACRAQAEAASQGPRRLLVVAGEHRRAGAARERLDQRALCGAGVLELVDHQVREALGDRPGERRPLPEQPGQLEHGVDVVHRRRRTQHRVVAARRSPRTPAPWRPNRARSACRRPARRPSARSARPSPPRTSARRSDRRSGRAARPGSRGSRAGAAGSSSIRSSSIARRSAGLSDSKKGSISASVGVLAEQPSGRHRVGVDDAAPRRRSRLSPRRAPDPAAAATRAGRAPAPARRRPPAGRAARQRLGAARSRPRRGRAARPRRVRRRPPAARSAAGP